MNLKTPLCQDITEFVIQKKMSCGNPWTWVTQLTPPRTPRISRLKSQILKPTFLI